MRIIRHLPDGSSMIHSMLPSLNRMEPHANFMPVEQELCLDGIWDFHYYEHLSDLPDEINLNQMPWSPIAVPSCWQLQGYGKPKYINTRYEFEPDALKLTPPMIPEEKTSVGVYRRALEYDCGAERRVILALDGYSACVQAYVNEVLVGYAANGRSITEFDITDAVRTGRNEVVLIVFQFGAGSFLECQDMWRLSGVFRSVRVYSQPTVSIRDVYLWCTVDRDLKHAAVHAEVKIHNAGTCLVEPVMLKCELRDDRDRVVAISDGYTGNLSDRFEEFTFFREPLPIQANVTRTAYSCMEVDTPRLWSADDPYLYRIVIQAGSQQVSLRCGIRDVRIENGVFLVNYAPVKLKGVNRHEFSPTGGYAISHEDMVRDIRLMKQHNINAVRCAHYPQAPEWYALCDEYGLYVMDEANIESHGISYRGNVLPGNDLRWLPHTLDRIIAMVECQKNHPSVVMWSVGNELGFGECVATAAAVIRSLDSRPVHKRQMNCVADMDSETYPTIQLMREHSKKKPGRAFLTNEYAHAMGNACGSLGEYWDTIYADPTLIGGFVWEWKDHGLVYGAHRYSYGGDFQEAFHDGNFCIDGLIQPDCQPTAKLAEVKKVHENVVIHIDCKHHMLTITNRFPHSSLDAYHLQIQYLAGERSLYEQIEQLKDIAPGQSREIQLHTVTCPHGVEVVLTASVRLTQSTAWCDAGHEIAWAQAIVQSGAMNSRTLPADGICHRTMADCEEIELKNGAVVRCLWDGSMTYQINQLSVNRIRLNVMRAPTDNDLRSSAMRETPTWLELGLHQLQGTMESFVLDERKAMIQRRVTYRGNGCTLCVTHRDWLLSDGSVFFDVDVQSEGTNVLPRIGVEMTVDGCLENMEWYGLGPMETYPDRARSGKLGVYHEHVHDQQSYIKPQEYGAHMECRYLQLSSDDTVLSVVAPVPYTMGALPYPASMLMSSSHREELLETQKTYVTVDYAQHGLGNRSCGPDVHPAYRLVLKHARFGFLLAPFALKTPVCPSELLTCYSPYCAALKESEEHYRDPSDLDRQRAVGLVKD